MGSPIRRAWPWFVALGTIAAACSDFEGASGSSDAGADAGVSDATTVDDRSNPPEPIDAGPCATCRSGQCYPDGGCFPLVFVTGQSYPGDFNATTGPVGMDLADSLCNDAGNANLAADAPTRGTFYAWLSDAKKSALTRVTLGADRPLVDTKGTPIIGSIAELVKDAGLAEGLHRDELGATVPDGEIVWTGTKVNGTRSTTAAKQCNDWRAGDASVGGEVGSTNRTDSTWTEERKGGRQCSQKAHLYCFESVK